MSNQLQKFQFTNNQNLNIRIINGEEYFLAKNVCDILDLGNTSQALSRVEQDDIILDEVIDSLGRLQKANFINEAGLYALIFQSRKPQAKEFKKWVFNEVLPQIRKTGSYVKNNISKLDSAFLFQIAQEMQKKESLIKEQQNKIDIQDNTIQKISNIQDTYSIREATKNLIAQENKLKDFLKSKKWIQYLSDGEEGKKLYSTAYSKENGFAIDKQVLNKAFQKFFHQFRITKKGMDYLIKHRQEIV